MQWQPDDSTNPHERWFLGAGFLGVPRISLIQGQKLIVWERQEGEATACRQGETGRLLLLQMVGTCRLSRDILA